MVEDSVEEIVLGGNKLRRLLYGQRLEAPGTPHLSDREWATRIVRETCLLL
jgi:hypothetical protein